MSCEVRKIDSNVVGLAYAEEVCIGELPDADGSPAGTEDGGVWYPLEPNSYDDFGGEITTTAREPINDGRQQKKGTTTDLEASGGFEQDVTQTNLTRLLQGFFFADAYERPGTHFLNGSTADKVALQNISAGSVVSVDTGEGAKFKVGDILKFSNMGSQANNQVCVITSITTDALTTNGTFVVETVGADAQMEIVGFRFPDQDLSLSFISSVLTLTSAAVDLTDLDLQVGEWIFIGGDDATEKITGNEPGYARIESITTTTLTLKEATFVPTTQAAEAGKTIPIYMGTFIKNQKGSSIKRRTYHLERTLGQDDNGTQSEYLVGAVPNEYTVNFSNSDKLMADLSFVALDNQLRTGTEGLKSGTRKSLTSEDAYNTSSDIYQMRLYKPGASLTPSSLFAYVMEGTLVINNGATGLKAIGTLGSMEINVGNFMVSGELQVYFATVEAVKAVKQNADVGFNMIAARDNVGFIYDIPLLSLGNGRITVEKDEPIMLPLEKQAAENANGYTLGAVYFSYLPTVAMA